MLAQIAVAQGELAKIENEVRDLRQNQLRLAQETDAPTEEWIRLCDLVGRLGPQAHQRALALFDQWVREEPSLWQPYLARGVARLHVGQQDRAIEDLRSVEGRVRQYDGRPRLLAFALATQAYASCKGNNTREGERLFAQAKKADKTSMMPHFLRGWSNLQRGRYSAAKADFQMALQLSKATPQAEAHEAMAFLLAVCPNDNVRDGAKAVEHGTRAAELTRHRDWICLDTLGAACAEAGDFDSAVKWANQALERAPPESRDEIRQRVGLYREGRPYHLE
jgi:tetratricopeptide (TPR) repeat protein